MQRLGENAMWLREDNRSEQNEIVLPYDSELALWDRPSWIDSLLRLRWCCPGASPTSATVKEQPSHQHQKHMYNKKYSNQYREQKPAKPKKSKKKKKKQQVHALNNTNDYSRAYPYMSSEYDAPPPPPPLHNNKYEAHPQERHNYQKQKPGYPQSKQPPSVLPQQRLLQQSQNYYVPQQQLKKHSQHMDHDLLNSFRNNPPQQPQANHVLAQSEHFAVSSLSSSESDCQENHVGSASEVTALAPSGQDPVTPAEDRPSKHAAAAAEAAAATLKKHAGLPQPRPFVPNNNNHRPPLIHRGVTPTQHAALQQQDATMAPSPAAVKPPLPVNGRSRSLSPSSKRPSSPNATQPGSPNVMVRPRLHSESSKRSMGTSSTRHRRKAHESFEFSTNSLQRIVLNSNNNKDEELSRTSPPAYIECPTHHSLGDWSSFDKLGDDDNSLMNLSVDEEISQLISRIPASQPVGYISPVDSSDTDILALRSRDANLPALSWMNSWAAQGDAAAGNPAGANNDASHEGQGKSVRIREKPLPPAPGKHPRTQHPSISPHHINVERPVFLPRCRTFDKPIRKSKSHVVISGWAAISLSDQLRNRLVAMEGPLQLKRSDIAYFQLIQNSDRRKPPILRVKRESEDHDIVLKERYDHQFQSQEVCGRAGRCVSLVEVATRQVLLTILPVSLPKYFFRGDGVVEDKYFSTWQNALFTPFTTVPPRLTREEAGWGPEYCMTRYAPDEQYDAATHVLFALDSVLTVEKMFYPTLAVG